MLQITQFCNDSVEEKMKYTISTLKTTT